MYLTCSVLGQNEVENSVSYELCLVLVESQVLLTVQSHQLSLALVEFLSIILIELTKSHDDHMIL